MTKGSGLAEGDKKEKEDCNQQGAGMKVTVGH
jgi:hypothetical protein